MIGALIIVTFLGVLVLAPLAFGIWKDRSSERGLALAAGIQAAVNRVLGGESFLSVEVKPATFWRAGRILLWVPTGYEWLIEAAWNPIFSQVPCNYEVVVRPTPCAQPEPAALKPAA